MAGEDNNVVKYAIGGLIVLLLIWMWTSKKAVTAALNARNAATKVKVPVCEKGWTHHLFHPEDTSGRCLKDCPTGYSPDPAALAYCIDKNKILLPQSNCSPDWAVVDDTCVRPQMAPKYTLK